MQQPCSNIVERLGLDLDKHREEIRRLVAEAPDEPTYGEFKQTLSYATKKEKGELVKDISSFANADLEALGGYGYIVFGIANDGRVVGAEGLTGDPPSEIRQIVNGRLDQPVDFEYVTCEVDDKDGGKKRVAAVVVPDSTRRPHVTSREIKEQVNGRDKFWLRAREVWVRKTGGRELATAEDLDVTYEGTLRRLVASRVRPLEEAVVWLDRDLADMKSATPELSFGFATPDGVEPAEEGTAQPLTGYVISSSSWKETRQLLEMADKISVAGSPQNVAFGSDWPSLPTGGTAAEYTEYAARLRGWMQIVERLLVLEFTLSNTGQSTAEDIEIILEGPSALRPGASLPEKPDPPGTWPLPDVHLPVTKQNYPESLIGPHVHILGDPKFEDTFRVRWEIGKPYHGRPLTTSIDEDDLEGLLVSEAGLRVVASRTGNSGVELQYTIHAGNLREPVRGTLVLR